MSATPLPPVLSPSFFSLIEPLESRIAPAGVTLLLGPSAQGGAGYSDSHFVKTSTNVASDPISAVVGAGDAAHPTYYAKLPTGSKVFVFGNGGFNPLIGGKAAGQATIGNIVAFFVDKNNDGVPTANELTGLALGKQTFITVSGSVDGDIVSNLNDASADPTTWKLGGSSEPLATAHDLLKNGIVALNISGDVNGSIVAGSTISNVQVTGKVNQILGGTAANGYAYDFDTKAAANPDGGDSLAVSAPNTGVAGVSINKVQVGGLGFSTAVGKIQSGDGGANARGGAITNVRVLSDTDGLTIQSGNGGAGTAGTLASGGLINTVIINGLGANQSDTTANSAITVKSGDGGHSSGGAPGGQGGAISNLFVGFSVDPSTGKLRQSVSSLADTVLVQGGAGGGGKIGGKGSTLTGIHIFSSPTGTGHDISVIGGTGGASDVASSTGARAGAGGFLIDVDARNLNSDLSAPALVGSKNILHAGSAGAATNTSAGGLGGSIVSARILGFMADVRAGDGSSGSQLGGGGGNLLGITLEDLSDSSAAGIQVQNAVIDAGAGANSSGGRGGAGGIINGLFINNGNFAQLTVNQETSALNGNQAANGGNGAVGIGGKGGAVSNLRITGVQSPDLVGTTTTFQLRSGNGGTGPVGGGAGDITGVTLSTPRVAAHNLSLNVHSGTGGASTGTNGRGGVGGNIISFTANTQLLDLNGQPVLDAGSNRQFNDATAALVAGNGGAGGSNGAGGLGGSILITNINTDGGVTLTAGNGGNGNGTGFTGSGGGIRSTFDLANNGAVTLTAGDAGATGGAPAVAFRVNPGGGGSISTAHVRGLNALTLSAGDGHNGGAGGGISNVFFSAPSGAANNGAVNVTAGDGSGAGNVAGNGGFISGVKGYAGFGGTAIRAGLGGASSTRAAAGGSVSEVDIYGGGGTSNLVVEAGNASTSTGATLGGRGGNVTGVRVQALDPGAHVLHVEAGNGGNTGLSTGHGGLGGSIDQVFVNHDIGIRAGQPFGADTMGGLFAGSGGINTTVAGRTANTLDALDGRAGNVTNITADAIAAIVAGRPNVGAVITKQNLVTVVDHIHLNGAVTPVVDNTPVNSYANFFTANLVGGNHSADPNSTANSTTFDPGEYGDTGAGNAGTFGIGDTTNASTDGFVATFILGSDLSFKKPEALLTVDANGNSVFQD